MDAQPSFNLQSLVGQTLDGKVLLEAVLGQGGMGAVYRGKHLLLERSVAVKILRPEIVAVDGVTERFFREARMAASIDHPNIVTVFDFGTLASGGAYLILELIDGVSLRALLQEKVFVEPPLAFAVFREICGAVEVAHRKGIVHRDLKPENIMLKRLDDDGVMIKVLDFGLAKVVEAAETSSSITRTGEILGTPVYMSPEHCDGAELDARSDVYSLAIILYEMLASQPPFRGRIASVLTSHIQKPPMSMREINPQIPPVIDEVVLGALEKKPEDRPASTKEFWEKLEAAYEEGFGEKPPPDIEYIIPQKPPEPVVHTTLKETDPVNTRSESPNRTGAQQATIQESGTMVASSSVAPAGFSTETRTNLAGASLQATEAVNAPARRTPVLAAGIVIGVLSLTGLGVAFFSRGKTETPPVTPPATATPSPTATPQPPPADPAGTGTPTPDTATTRPEEDPKKKPPVQQAAKGTAKPPEKKKDDNVFKKMGRFFGIGGDKKEKKKNN